MIRTPAIISDIDGTLLHHPGDPYDHDLYPQYTPDPAVVETVNLFWESSHEVILLTGRSERHRAVTEESLYRAGVRYDALYMRPNGEERKDFEYKAEVYHEIIAPAWKVKLVLEDRQRVVDMWRGLGLKVFQVMPGNY